MHDDWLINFEYCPYSIRLLDKIHSAAYRCAVIVDIITIKKAIYYAKTYHGSQNRISGEPFYSHPLEVAYMLTDFTLRTDLLVTAILHDTIEDTELTYEIIAKNFGSLIAGQVNDLTRIKNGRKVSSKELIDTLWEQGKIDVLLIKLLDRLHNLRTIEGKPAEKINKTSIETIQHFITIAISLGFLEIEDELIKNCYRFILGKEPTATSKNTLSSVFPNYNYDMHNHENDNLLKNIVTSDPLLF
jgi:(p)ppGpp synthase/HD superfamily hydrolase